MPAPGGASSTEHTAGSEPAPPDPVCSRRAGSRLTPIPRSPPPCGLADCRSREAMRQDPLGIGASVIWRRGGPRLETPPGQRVAPGGGPLPAVNSGRGSRQPRWAPLAAPLFDEGPDQLSPSEGLPRGMAEIACTSSRTCGCARAGGQYRGHGPAANPPAPEAQGWLALAHPLPPQAQQPQDAARQPGRVSPGPWSPPGGRIGRAGVQPGCCSRRRICWLRVDWVRWIRSARG